MAGKEIVLFVAPEPHQDNPLSPMEQYFAEALHEEVFSVSATSLATPRSSPGGGTQEVPGVGRLTVVVGRRPHAPARPWFL